MYSQGTKYNLNTFKQRLKTSNSSFAVTICRLSKQARTIKVNVTAQALYNHKGEG